MSLSQSDSDAWIAFAAERDAVVRIVCGAIVAVVLALLLGVVALALR